MIRFWWYHIPFSDGTQFPLIQDPLNSWIWWIVIVKYVSIVPQVILFSNLVFGTSSQVSVTVIWTLLEFAGIFVLNQPPLPENPISMSIGHVELTVNTIVYSVPGFMNNCSIEISLAPYISSKFLFKRIVIGKGFATDVSHKSMQPISMIDISWSNSMWAIFYSKVIYFKYIANLYNYP